MPALLHADDDGVLLAKLSRIDESGLQGAQGSKEPLVAGVRGIEPFVGRAIQRVGEHRAAVGVHVHLTEPRTHHVQNAV